SALGEHAAAIAEADEAVRAAPTSVDARLLRGRVRRRTGDLEGASVDARAGIALCRSDPRVKTLLGRVLVQHGRPHDGLALLDEALLAGAARDAHLARAQVLLDLGRAAESVANWTLALRDDREDAEAFLGRARCFIKLGRLEPALADLESATNWSGDRPNVLAPIAVAYASCLPARRDRLGRVLCLSYRAAGVKAP